MGSFNATCIVSNLPIEAGTPVRFLALVGSRYYRGNEHICYVAGRWQLRCPPLRAQYNDYGSIENLEPRLTNRVFFESLSREVVEKGVGNNRCHDVQVRRGMDVDQWLEALWEGRVEVRDRERYPMLPGWEPPPPPDGVPTLARLEALFKSRRLPVVTSYNAKGFVLDEVAPGFIRVRVSDFAAPAQERKRLEKALKLMEPEYAAMMTCGTGSYSEHAEVLVAPQPLKGKGVHFSSTGVAKTDDHLHAPRPVSQAMVREDVWQILLQTPLHDWRSGGDFMFAKMHEAARAALAEELKAQDNSKNDYLDRLMRRDNHDNLFRAALYPNEGEFGFGLRESFDLALELQQKRGKLETFAALEAKALGVPMPAAQAHAKLEEFVTDLAETVYVQWVYSMLHGQWHPTTNSSQEGNWDEHRAFLTALSKLEGCYEKEEQSDG